MRAQDLYGSELRLPKRWGWTLPNGRTPSLLGRRRRNWGGELMGRGESVGNSIHQILLPLLQISPPFFLHGFTLPNVVDICSRRPVGSPRAYWDLSIYLIIWFISHLKEGYPRQLVKYKYFYSIAALKSHNRQDNLVRFHYVCIKYMHSKKTFHWHMPDRFIGSQDKKPPSFWLSGISGSRQVYSCFQERFSGTATQRHDYSKHLFKQFHPGI